MEIDEIFETFEKREEWVVKGSTMDVAIESMLNLFNKPAVKYNKENHSLDNVYGGEGTVEEIEKFINEELGDTLVAIEEENQDVEKD